MLRMFLNAFSSQEKKGIDFIDRDCYRWLIHDAYKEILENPASCKIIFLYGPGGFGKTFLLRNCVATMTDPKAKPIHISLEITHKDDKLDILMKFRSALPKKEFYPLFDYAAQFLWNSLNTSQMDEKIFGDTRNSLRKYITSSVDTVVVGASAIFPPPIGIATASISELIDGAYHKLRIKYSQHPVRHKLDEIENMQPHELIDLLPELLGTDIHTAFLNKTLVFVIDSYQEYSPNLIDASSWLTALVQKIGYGLFIITSRENTIWPEDIKDNVIPKKLDILPEDDVRKELEKHFNSYPKLVENIISVTGCIPIYLDLAIKSIENSDQEKPLYDQHYFKNQEDIIRKFLIHLPYEERAAIRTLAIVKIFDEEIFEYLVKDLNLPIQVNHFGDICNRTLIRNFEYDNCFFKTHEVFSDNISLITEKHKIQRIFKSYLEIIKNRIINNHTNIQIKMLFKHLLSLIIDNALSISELDIENLLDIYFVIKESLLTFDCSSIKEFDSNQPLHDIYYFLKALSEERQDSKIRLNWLKQIQESSCMFGKHIKSYQLIKGYLQALCEGYECFKNVIETINKSLTESEKPEWYYGQTKIFFGDCQISYGNFRTGISELQTYEGQLPKLIGKENDAFQLTRHIAHGYRFNMFLEDAENLYRTLIEGENIIPTPLQKIYIFTNLCETCCYFKPTEVFKIKEEALSLAIKFNDLKSQGKIFYSLAIACLSEKDYESAERYINDSIKCNQRDGYKAGQLYAYMARSYCEYAQYGKVSDITLDAIKTIQKDIQVYGYFSLPIAMMQEDYQSVKKIRDEYEWLDFDKTLLTYRHFLDSIRFFVS